VDVAAILSEHREVETSLGTAVHHLTHWLTVEERNEDRQDTFLTKEGHIVLHAREVVEHLGHKHGGLEVVNHIEALAALQTESDGRLCVAPGHAISNVLKTRTESELQNRRQESEEDLKRAKQIVSSLEELRRAWMGIMTPARTRGVSKPSCADMRESATEEKKRVSSSPFSIRHEISGMTCFSIRCCEYCREAATVPILEAQEANTSESVAMKG
jgi:hypothetical protein